MPALGCLTPFVLLIVVGAGIRGMIGGTVYAVWGGIAGPLIGGLGALLAVGWCERAWLHL